MTQQLAVPTQEPRFTGIHLQWRVDRSSRVFRVRVVEPRDYVPELHGEIFTAVLTSLLAPEPRPIDPLAGREVDIGPEPFDLVTFPEAFVPAETLVGVIRSLDGVRPLGCLHVGLRPSGDGGHHLFTVDELNAFVGQLESIADSIAADLAGFRRWLGRQRLGHAFNVGCLFAVDSAGMMRLCLHPKAVSSHFEVDPLPKRNMKEADLLTLITLIPVDQQLLSVTVQPLICSDVLSLATDTPGGAPMEAVTRYAHCFSDPPPDHIDIVSVVTCTPQRQVRLKDGQTFGEWHEQFRDAFRTAAAGPNLVRHHFSAFVLSNFRTLKGGAPGGLSGVFLPVPPKYPHFHSDVIVSAWGRPKAQKQGNNGWSRPEDDALVAWDNRGFIAALDPFAASADALVRIFAFNIHRLPREHSFWTPTHSLTHCEVLIGRREDSGLLIFDVLGSTHV